MTQLKNKITYMEQKFIKLTTTHSEYYINPNMISCIQKPIESDKIIVKLFDQTSFSPNESFNEIMKKIKEANQFKFEL
jgi:hypothetical protein